MSMRGPLVFAVCLGSVGAQSPEFLAKRPDTSSSEVWCGRTTTAASCNACPKSEGSVATWCSGDCIWSERDKKCAEVPENLQHLSGVSCGSQSIRAPSCEACPTKDGSVAGWCSADCLWNERAKVCSDRQAPGAIEAEKADRQIAALAAGGISCGRTRATSCGVCPNSGGNTASWCNGDCLWNEKDKTCGDRKTVNAEYELASTTQMVGGISCGRARAASCGTCPVSGDNPAMWCSGECLWSEKDKTCIDRKTIVTAYESPASTTHMAGRISCGKTRADSCGACPVSGDNPAMWCSGECLWSEKDKVCTDRKTIVTAVESPASTTQMAGRISCGKTRADSCGACPVSGDNPAMWCSGECLWSEKDKRCADRTAIVPPPTTEMTGGISCGRTRALSCATCPVGGDNAATWCSGDCLWSEKDKTCVDRKTMSAAYEVASTTQMTGGISCGHTRALSCAKCPAGGDNAATWCHGDCLWNEKDKTCADRSVITGSFVEPASLGPNEGISCGHTRALSCGECPVFGDVAAHWCNGACLWNEKDKVCGLDTVRNRIHEL